jgi:hypothetical protein
MSGNTTVKCLEVAGDRSKYWQRQSVLSVRRWAGDILTESAGMRGVQGISDDKQRCTEKLGWVRAGKCVVEGRETRQWLEVPTILTLSVRNYHI